jgi:uncharacterized protein (DUF362 family)
MKPIVSLMKVENIELSLREALEHHGGMKAIVPYGSSVLIKPNFTCALPPETGAASDPEIAAVLARLALESGASKVIIADGIGAGHVTIKDVKGLDEISKKKAVEIRDLNDEITRTVYVPDPLVVDRFDIPHVVLECDVLINLAKLKVHPLAVFSLAMKNMIGVLPGRSYADQEEAKKQGFPTPVIPGGGKKIFHELARDGGSVLIQKAIVDLNTVVRSHFTVIDGIYGMEGKGAPVRGTPVKMDVLIAGTDIVAVEAVGAAVMGFNPDSIPYFKHAVDKGVGYEYKINNIDIRGAKLNDVRRRFEPASASYLWKMKSKPNEKARL